MIPLIALTHDGMPIVSLLENISSYTSWSICLTLAPRFDELTSPYIFITGNLTGLVELMSLPKLDVALADNMRF